MAAPQIESLGRYKIRRVLGKGAMGVVYEGLDPRLNRKVAIKTILVGSLDADTARDYSKRFAREAQAVARLNHPNIVQVYDFGEEGEIAYIVMEFISGSELKSSFDANARFDIGKSVRLMSELLDALEFAHNAGVIHRDIKPANVMVDVEGHAKLADFGVARVSDPDSQGATQAGTMVGTPAYMSPEQIQGLKIDRRTDIFSAGVILYQFLTGQKPFQGGGAWTMAKKILQDDPPAPSTIIATVSAEYDRVVYRSLAKNPANRYQSAREFATALQRVLAGLPSEDPDEDRTLVSIVPDRSEGFGTPQATQEASEVEIEFWRAIKDSDDPEELELYLQEFPQGAYTDLARNKIAELLNPGKRASSEAHDQVAKKADQERAVREANARTMLEAETKARLEAEARARREADERARKAAEERARQDAQEKARREAIAKAKRQAEERAQREAEARAQQAAKEEARRQAEAKARREAEEQARRDAAEKARLDAEAKARREAEERARREAEERARRAAEERARKEAEERARKEAEEWARREAEERARREAEEKAQREAEAKAKREAEEKARLEAEARAKREAEERARREAEAKAKREAEEKARREAEEKARREAEAKAKREAEERAKREAEAKAKREAEEKVRREAEARAKREAEEKARREAEARAKREAEEKARREAEEWARIEAKTRAFREAEAQARREAEEEARRQAEEIARQEAAEKAEAEAKRRSLERAMHEAEKKAVRANELAMKREAAELAARAAEELVKFEEEERPQREAREKAMRAAKEKSVRLAQQKAMRMAEEKAISMFEPKEKREAREQARREEEGRVKRQIEALIRSQKDLSGGAGAGDIAGSSATPIVARSAWKGGKLASALATVFSKPGPTGEQDGPEALCAKAALLERSGKVSEAVVLLKFAAGTGNGPAARKLGEIYANGAGDVSADKLESGRWFSLAELRGEKVSRN